MSAAGGASCAGSIAGSRARTGSSRLALAFSRRLPRPAASRAAGVAVSPPPTASSATSTRSSGAGPRARHMGRARRIAGTRRDAVRASTPRKLMLPGVEHEDRDARGCGRRLGWDYTYETSVLRRRADRRRRRSTAISSSSAHGDPSLSDDDGAGRVFETWAERLKALGVRTIARPHHRRRQRVRRRDARAAGRGTTWIRDIRPASARCSSTRTRRQSSRIAGSGRGQRRRSSCRSPSDGSGLDACAIASRPAAPAIRRASSRDAPASGQRGARAPRLDSARRGAVTRAVAGGTTRRCISSTALRSALIASGIDVRGEAVDIDELPERRPQRPSAAVLDHRSPPLSTLAETLMKLSQNQYAETLLKTLGRGERTADHSRRPDGWSSTGRESGASASGRSYRGRLRAVALRPRDAEALVAILTHVDRDGQLEASRSKRRCRSPAGTARSRIDEGHAGRRQRPREDRLDRQRAVALRLRCRRPTASRWCSRSSPTTSASRPPRSTGDRRHRRPRWPNSTAGIKQDLKHRSLCTVSG